MENNSSMNKEEVTRSAEVNIKLEIFKVRDALDADNYYDFLIQLDSIIQTEKRLARGRFTTFEENRSR